MEQVLEVAAWAAAVTAVIVASKHTWGVFVSAVRSAVHEEISKFHRELDSVDTFWSERIDKLEACVRDLKDQIESISERLGNA